MDQSEQDFNDNQNYSIYGDDTHEQNSFNKFKRINDYIENHYHDSNSDDVDMDGNNIGKRNAWSMTSRMFDLLLLTQATTIQNL